jgi:hypothetical protein
MSHDAATGYIHSTGLSKTGMSSSYSKTQIGSVYQQLQDGARALDLRPKLLLNGTVVFQHGAIQIPVSFKQLVSDAVRWCETNDEELVLLLASNFAYELSSSSSYYGNDDKNEQPAIVQSMSAAYQELGVAYLQCVDVHGMTVGEAMELAALPSGGYLLAIDSKDYYGTFCGKSNWIESRIVTCWDRSSNTTISSSCKFSSSGNLQRLSTYVLASANNAATDDSSILGPPSNLYCYPFNEIQALWQVDTHAVLVGTAHVSSLLEDNRISQVNEYMVQLIYNENFDAISLFAVDNVALNGNALLSVVRNSCGQTDIGVCGKQLDAPQISSWHVDPKRVLGVLVGIYLVWFVAGAALKVWPNLLPTLLARVQHSFDRNDFAGALVFEGRTDYREFS